MTRTRDRSAVARGVLLGTFVGDALGARWEGSPATDLDGGRDRLDRSLSAATLTYTDDTQLTLALAEHLCDHVEVDPARLTTTFAEHFEPHRGYARGMFGLVEAWQAGLPVEQAARAVFPDGSFGNGAAMRVAPVGVVLVDAPVDIIDAAHRQAAVTHAHPIGMDAAGAQAHAVGLAARTGAFGLAELRDVIDVCRTDELRRAMTVAAELAAAGASLPEVEQRLGTGVLADQSVPTALWVAAVAEDLPTAVTTALALGGDVDTIAAMACAVLGAACTDAAIPPTWLGKLEDGVRGRSYAVALAARLVA
ncbi:MAG TPA: ADP-ribosylglycohydrolase family protein [Egibacteraceae bacterium]|nr:ADP-ribosylglycohydrolase family protein [Egibacteraceae bacterium]